MADLKLAQLPDRTPVKLTITLSAELSKMLSEHAAVYAASYAQEEPVVELIPGKLAAFLESARDFSRTVRNRAL